MDNENFGTTEDYLKAFKAVRAAGIHENHMAMLQAHLAAPRHTTTWARLAKAVGYPSGSSVNLQYGKLACRIARELGINDKPLDPYGIAWWLWVLVRYSDERDPVSGHSAFALRLPVVDALRQFWPPGGATYELLPDEFEVGAPIHEGARYQVLVNAYERNSEARRRCIEAHGTICCICGFNFATVYGPEAEGYIHVHHIKPLSEIGGKYMVDPVKDLLPVCPNCHAVLHLGGLFRSVDDLRQLLQKSQQAKPFDAPKGSRGRS